MYIHEMHSKVNPNVWQRNLMSEAKGKPMNPAWAADEIPKSKPPKTTPLVLLVLAD
jgi:hypothetical protein